MKTIFILQCILLSLVTLGQKTILLDDSSFLNGQVDSIKVISRKYSAVVKLTNGVASIKVPASDTLTIFPADFVPLEISGLKNITSDTLTIVGYSLYKYCSNDTIIKTHEKKSVFSSQYKKTMQTKIIYCDKSTQSILEKSTVKVNGITYTTSVNITTSFETQIACGKRNSYSVQKYHSDGYYGIVLKKTSP